MQLTITMGIIVSCVFTRDYLVLSQRRHSDAYGPFSGQPAAKLPVGLFFAITCGF